MSPTTVSVLTTNLSDLSLPLCLNSSSHNANHTLASGATLCNNTEVHSPVVNKANRKPNLKVYLMQPVADTGNRLYLSYDPMIGIRTAAILGSALFIMMIYIIYKAKCRRRQWTSEDQLFLEKYRRRIHERNKRNNHNGSHSSRWSVGNSVKESLTLENTANWIRSQPLNTDVSKKTLKTVSNMCNTCIHSLHHSSCPLCSNSDIQVSHGEDTPLSADSGLASIKKAKRCRVDKALFDVCHLHLPGLHSTSKDTQLIENDIRHGRQNKNSNLQHDNSVSPSPSSNAKYEDIFKFDVKTCQQNTQKTLDGIKAARSFHGYPLHYELQNGVSPNHDNILIPPDLNCSHSPGSSHSDSIDLDKHIDIGIHNTSPTTQRAAEKPKLKYLPLYMMPLTNISVSESTNVTPKSAPHLEDLKTPSGESKMVKLSKPPAGESVQPNIPNIKPASHSPDYCQLHYCSENTKRSVCPPKALQLDIKISPSGEEGVPLCELSKGLTYIDGVDENEDNSMSPLNTMKITQL